MPNPIQALAMLPKMSEQQLVMTLQANDGSIPAYAVMAELQARKKRAAGFAGAPPTTSVKQDMLQGGLQSLAQQTMPQPQQTNAPLQMPQGMPLGAAPQGMAEGGRIKRYDEGGMIDAPQSSYWDQMGNIARIPLRGLKWLMNAPGSGAPLDPTNSAYPAGGVFQAGAARRPTQHFSDAASYGPGTPAPALADTTPSAPPTSRAAAPSGLASISASSATRTGGVAPTIDKFTPKAVVPRPWSEIQAEFPADQSAAEQMKAIRDSDTSGADRQSAKWEALMRTGIGMARTPGPMLSALATGAGQGLDSLAANNRMIQQNQMDQRKELTSLAVAQGMAKARDYMAMKDVQYKDAQIQNMNNVDQYNVWKANLDSGDKAAERATQLQVASIHASAVKAGQADFNMMRLVQNAQSQAVDEFNRMHPANGMEYIGNPQKREMDLAAWTAARLKTIPGVEKYAVMPQAGPSMGGFVNAPPQGANVARVNWGQ